MFASSCCVLACDFSVAVRRVFSAECLCHCGLVMLCDVQARRRRQMELEEMRMQEVVRKSKVCLLLLVFKKYTTSLLFIRVS